nr:HlyD family efflux transporter periplasmic adaptor subunit [Bacteroidota bacterium]
MIRSYLFYFVAAGVLVFLVFASLHYKGGGDAMVAQVESQMMAISYQKPVLIRKIYVSPGQVVDSGDLLIEVERPDLALDLDKKLSEKNQFERRIDEARTHYHNSLKILQADYERKVSKLMTDKDELEYNLHMSHEREKKMDGLSSLSFTSNDTLTLKRIQLISSQLESYTNALEIEKLQLLKTLQYDTSHYHSELVIIDKEIDELENESMKLIQRAEKSGTIGNLFVQLNELVPPYKTLLSVYDLNPNLIKAFIHERLVKDLHIGSKVKVESVHKKYFIEGEIVEIGSRITSYPDKINPLVKQKSYGQEIFINIPDENNFLNGEKVYVYVVDNEN